MDSATGYIAMYIMTMHMNLRRITAQSHFHGPQSSMTNWKDGARLAMDMIEKPDALTANDWNRPATASVPAPSDSTTSRPELRMAKSDHSIVLRRYENDQSVCSLGRANVYGELT